MIFRRATLPLTQDPSGRFLPWLIAFMVFLACLALASVLAVERVIERWDSGLSGQVTVQVPAADAPAERQRRLELVLDLLQQTPGVRGVAVLEEAEVLALVEPWLGDGALVADVDPTGPAGQAGLKAGDVILRFGNTAITEVRDLTRAVADVDPGESANLTVWRDGTGRDLAVEVGSYPKAEQMAEATTGAPDAEGLEVAPLGVTLGDQEEGAVVLSIAPNGAAELRPGDVIAAVGQSQVANAKEARAAIDAAKSGHKKSVLLLVRRDGQQRYVAVPLRDA